MFKLSYMTKKIVNRIKVAYHLRRAQEVEVPFAGHFLTLNLKWKHERSYYKYIATGKINGPLGLDVWVLSRFVKPGHTVLDAGANIGFTCLLMELAGASEIHGFEPDPRLIGKLKKNCEGNRIFIHEKALGDKRGSMNLMLSTAHNQGSTLSGKMVNKFPDVFKDAEPVQAEVVTIDDFFQDKHFDLFKIDVEGAELSTVKGACSLLKNDRPNTIYIEAYEEFFSEINEFLQDFYEYAYRVVCDHKGNCRLFPIDIDLSELDSNNIYTMPPAYIYSAVQQVELSSQWTQPAIAGKPA